MWEIGKQVQHNSDPSIIYTVVGESVDKHPILQRQDGSNVPFVPSQQHMYQPYTPPPPTTKHYVNTYINNNEYPHFGSIWPTKEIARDVRDRRAVDLIELELSPTGKFIKAKSVM